MTAAEPLAPAWRETGEPWTLGEEPLAASEFADLRYSQFTGLNIGLIGAVDYDGMSIEMARALAVQLTELVAAADAHADEVADLDRVDMPAREAWRARHDEMERERAAAREQAQLARDGEPAETHTGPEVVPTATTRTGDPTIIVRTPREQRRHLLRVRLAAAGIVLSHAAAFTVGVVMF